MKHIQIFIRRGIKALSLCSLGFSVHLAFSEISLPGNTNPVQEEQSPWGSKTHPSCELFVEEQIRNQTGPLTLLNLTPLNREEIIATLKEDFNISIGTDSPSLFSKHFLAYLYRYFEMMFPKKTSFPSLYLHALSKDNPQLVDIEGNHMYFSKNAGDKIINKTIREFVDDYCESQNPPEETTLTFEYNNDFYDQLNRALLTNQDIATFIKTHMGITLEVDETDPLYKDTQAFTREELLMLLAQILDMPFHLKDNLALKRILRMRPDYKYNMMKEDGHELYGLYDPDTQTIQITDLAFASNPYAQKQGNYGGATILHEMAHALWYGLAPVARQEYENLFWDGNTNFMDEFISVYASTNIEEDFAELMTFYMDNSERLKHTTPGKFHWLKQHIFRNVEYFTDSTDNIRTLVTSESEDISPPYFLNSPEESVILSVEKISSDEITLTAEIEGLFDNISGIKQIHIFLRSVKSAYSLQGSLSIQKNFTHLNSCPISPTSCVRTDDEPGPQASLLDILDFIKRNPCPPSPTSCVRTDDEPGPQASLLDILDFIKRNPCPPSPTSCVRTDDNKPGWYIIQTIKSSNALPGYYAIKFISVEDYAGNERTFWSYLENQTIYFPGTVKPIPVEDSSQQFTVDNIDREAVARTLQANTEIVAASKTAHRDTLAHVIIPESGYMGFDSISSYFDEARLYFKGSRTEKKFHVTVDMDSLPDLHSRFNSPQRPGTIALPVVIPKEFPSEKYELSHIYMTKDYNTLQDLEVKMNGFYVDHTSTEEDKTALRVKTKDIVLKVLTGLNQEGGNISVLATLPIEGFDTDKEIHTTIFMRTPNGNILHKQLSGTPKEGLTKDETGNFYISAQFDLEPHPAQGEYTLSEISLTETYYERLTRSLYRGMFIERATQQTTKRLIERNIRATVQIKTSP